MRVFADLGELRYYKNSKKGTPASGTVALNNVEWCRQVGESLDFEFLSGTRVFSWRAETVVSMQEWMKWVQDAIKAADELDKEYQQARERVNTPARIQRFDRLETEQVGECNRPSSGCNGTTRFLQNVTNPAEQTTALLFISPLDISFIPKSHKT